MVDLKVFLTDFAKQVDEAVGKAMEEAEKNKMDYMDLDVDTSTIDTITISSEWLPVWSPK